jgi:hypothetical protein
VCKGSVLPHADKLRVGAEPVCIDAEDAVTHPEFSDSPPDRFNLSGQLAPEDSVLRSEQTAEEANEERLRLAESAIRAVDRRGVDLDEDFVVLRYRSLDVF